MIREIRVNGYRSLTDFTINPNDGLNVLIGPNGSGKSNFVSLLDFISDALILDLPQAITNAGGISKTFSMESRENSYKPSIEVNFEGQMKINAESDPQGESFIVENIRYEYEIKISYSKKYAQLYIAKETLNIYFPALGDLKIRRTNTLKSNTMYENIEVTPSGHGALNPPLRFFGGTRDTKQIWNAHQSPDKSFFKSMIGDITAVSEIYHDISRHRSINIDPNIARAHGSISDQPQVNPSGHGLLLSLYMMQRNKLSMPTRMRARRPVGPRLLRGAAHQQKTFKSIVNWCKEIDPNIDDIVTDLDLETGRINGYINYQNGDTESSIPFSSISDGTAKWIALVSIIVSNTDYTVIEEPENYLHPRMQEVFVELCRAIIRNSEGRDQMFITSHSESILDQCKIDELQLFRRVEGTTQAVRPSNMNKFNELLEKSRFGLGHYYSIGALDV